MDFMCRWICLSKRRSDSANFLVSWNVACRRVLGVGLNVLSSVRPSCCLLCTGSTAAFSALAICRRCLQAIAMLAYLLSNLSAPCGRHRGCCCLPGDVGELICGIGLCASRWPCGSEEGLAGRQIFNSLSTRDKCCFNKV